MLITFQKFHAYNKVFFLNLNESAFYPPCIILLLVELISFSMSWVVARLNGFIETLTIRSLINFLSGGFENFVKQS